MTIPDTGTHFDFEWLATIKNRAVSNAGCPYLFGRAVWIGFNDLATKRPDLATQWHPTKNGDKKPTDFTVNSSEEVWWWQPYDDPITGNHFDFEWPATISNRTHLNSGCPFLTGNAVWPGFNDLASKYPELAKEWHPTKNGKKTPQSITYGSNAMVWWFLRYYDEKQGKYFDFEWPDTISHRVNEGRGCPYLSGKKVWVGFNDLATTHPELAAEFHPTKNGNLKVTDLTAGAHKDIWWRLVYDDPRTGKQFVFEWPASVNARSRGDGCPYLSGKKVYVGFNDLASLFPDIANEWHPNLNGTLKPTDVTYGSNRKVWWQVTYENETYEWFMSIYERTGLGLGCSELSGSNLSREIVKILKGKSIDFETEKTFDDLRAESGNYYRYDFFLPNDTTIIECDGGQHFKAIKHFGGESSFQKLIIADSKKNTYAFSKKIPILRIPYHYLRKRKELRKIVLNFIKTKEIPQEIIDFYSQFEFSNYVECVEKHHNSLSIAKSA